MRCAEFEARLNELLDRRQRPADDPALASHLDGCPRCRRRVSAFEMLCDVLPDRQLPAADELMTERVLAQLADGPAANRVLPGAARRSWRYVVGAGLAAALLLSAYSWRRAPTAAPAAPLSPGVPAVARTAPPAAVRPARNSVRFRPFDERYQELTLDRGQELALALLRMPDLAVDVASSRRPDAARTWGTVSESLRPVATSMHETLHILKRVLPVAEAQPDSSG